jgi:hypothetical protein
MTKMTAVEWLYEQIKFTNKDTYNELYEQYQQALEMERDQLILFGAQCMVETEKESGLGAIKIYELYFDKTFKSDNP